jgi:hypothetical protein
MDRETKEYLLELHDMIQKVVRTGETRIQGTQQALKSLSLFMAKVSFESPYLDDFMELLDEMAVYLDQGSQQPLQLLQMLRRLTMHIEGQSEHEITAFLVREESRVREQAQKIIEKVTARRQRQQVANLLLALYPFPSELH